MAMVLSLFPGIGLLDAAFEQEGFCVVRGPDVLWGGDIRTFCPPPFCFDGVIGGPPCQTFSRLANIVRANGFETEFGNLIPEFERVVGLCRPRWFLMENVPDAPLPAVEGYAAWSTKLNNRQCIDDDGKPCTQSRDRRWTFGVTGDKPVWLPIETAALEAIQFDYAATSAGPRAIPVALRAGGVMKRTRVGRNAAKDPLAHGTQRTKDGFAVVKRLQGVAPEFDLPAFTVAAKVKAVGNGVPVPMGRALARAVREVIEALDGPRRE